MARVGGLMQDEPLPLSFSFEGTRKVGSRGERWLLLIRISKEGKNLNPSSFWNFKKSRRLLDPKR